MKHTVLVLGSNGTFGAACLRAFETRQHSVRRYRRGTDMAEAARGCDIIVNGLNPPMYHDWRRLIPEITQAVLAAARSSGARILLPGNVYPFGREPGPWGAGTAHRPVSRKGEIRRAMEARYRDSGLPVTILRAGDFIDGGNGATFLNLIALKDLRKGRIVAPGRPEVRRAYAYLPDLAEAALGLSALDLPCFADIPFPGLTFSIADLKEEIERQTATSLRLARFPWWSLRLMSPFWELARELGEMRYLFDTDHSLDPGPLRALLPGARITPFETVIAAQLAGHLQGAPRPLAPA